MEFVTRSGKTIDFDPFSPGPIDAAKAAAPGEMVVAVMPTWFQKALFETSIAPRGCFKQAWAMKLMHSGHRCQLPRGFIKGRRVFVGK